MERCGQLKPRKLFEYYFFGEPRSYPLQILIF
jgi:hypothetical protein